MAEKALNVFEVKLVETIDADPEYAYYDEFVVVAADGDEAVRKAKEKAASYTSETDTTPPTKPDAIRLIGVEHLTHIDIP